MTVLGIETSCDETAAAVVRDGREVLSSIVFSQIPLHAPYGGVVPEIASRSHIEKLPGVIREAVSAAKISWADIDAVAVTYGPGLASSLLVGLSAAKGLAWSLGKPLVGINHVEAHIHSVFLSPDAPAPDTVLPMLALVVSGGHSAIVRISERRRCHVLGQTLDDAAGEAFDKGAKLLGLGYPGGPVMELAARRAVRRSDVVFPQGRIGADNPALGKLRADLCFSFSGLKTAMITHLKQHPVTCEADRDALAAAYQEAIVAALAARCDRALRSDRFAALAVGGGVSLNGALRARLAEVASARHVPLLLPLPKYCGDNAAMIAALAGSGIGVMGEAAFVLDATPGLTLAITSP